jgi:hypothetical protein
VPVQEIHTFLVHPGKSSRDQIEINGAPVDLTGNMFDLLNAIYSKSEEECNIGISFRPNNDGEQQNDCRDLLIGYLKSPSLDSGRLIAERLRENTDGRSGMGLLFLIRGKEGDQHKVVLSRFPTDSAIYVDEDKKQLTVAFLERVFMKNKTSYKAVSYRDRSLGSGGFWTGKAVDRQRSDPATQLSDYWIANFLLSHFALSGAAGTHRFAVALRDAVNKASGEVKHELVAAATLAPNMAGKPTSIDDFADQYNLSAAAREIIVGSLKNPRTSRETFTFDVSEFRNFIAYKSVELDNGAILTAGTEKFDDVFTKKALAKAGEIEYSTHGKIVDEKFKKRL